MFLILLFSDDGREQRTFVVRILLLVKNAAKRERQAHNAVHALGQLVVASQYSALDRIGLD